jgi:phosphoglycerol transferase MdoB-like AlkP superfamily enzyme
METFYAASLLVLNINIIANSLVFPLLLLLMIYVFRNSFLILLLHCFTLMVLLTSSIYYKYFQTIPHINLIRRVYTLPFIKDQILFHLFGATELIISGCILLSIGLSFKLAHDIRKNRFNIIPKKRLLVIFLIILMGYFAKGVGINLMRPVNRMHVSVTNSVRVLKQHGFTVVYLNQFIKHMLKVKKSIPWPGKINAGTQDVTPRDKDKKNVIVIQVEMFDHQIIDYKLGSRYVMPYLHSLKEQNAYFRYFFAHNRGGGSSDAELASLISLIPLETHSGFRTADFHKITPLNKVLAEEGYYCAGIHANTGRFFDRTQSYIAMGFDAFYDEEVFRGQAAGWHSKDKAFFEQTIEMLRSLPQPFFAYIITMQSHSPFRNHSTDPGIFDLKGLDKILQDYVLTMHEVDEGISLFMAQLEKSGFLNNTAILIYGDSSPNLDYHGYDRDYACHISPRGCHIPLLIIDPDPHPGMKDKVGSHLDIGPTILDLLGIEEPDGWLGSSLLQPGTGKAVLNYDRPYILINQGDDVKLDYNYDDYFRFIEYSKSMLDP